MRRMLRHWYSWTSRRQRQCFPKIWAHVFAAQVQPSPSLHPSSQGTLGSVRVAALLILHRISCTAWPDPMHHDKHTGCVFSCIFAVPLFQRLWSAGWKLSGKNGYCTPTDKSHCMYQPYCAHAVLLIWVCTDAVVSVWEENTVRTMTWVYKSLDS